MFGVWQAEFIGLLIKELEFYKIYDIINLNGSSTIEWVPIRETGRVDRSTEIWG
jgi:hypothetical protein